MQSQRNTRGVKKGKSLYRSIFLLVTWSLSHLRILTQKKLIIKRSSTKRKCNRDRGVTPRLKNLNQNLYQETPPKLQS